MIVLVFVGSLLGLMALGGVSLAVQAEEKIVLLTSWYAQAEQGG